MNHRERIRVLLTELQSRDTWKDDDAAWNAWLNLEKREPRDLLGLLSVNIRMELKARAIIVLLAPNLKDLPFRWDDQGSEPGNYVSSRMLKVKDIPRELVAFSAELLWQNITHATTHMSDRVREALPEYNDLIIQFLVALPESDSLARRLFDQFQINDLFPYWNMDDASGYEPFRKLLTTEDLPLKWKYLADQQMRNVVSTELGGTLQPRKEWEAALSCYATHIQMANYDGRTGYDRELFASQIRFITELPDIGLYEHELVSSWQLIHYLDALSGDNNRNVRHRLARVVVLSNISTCGGFSVYNPKSRSAADLMLREFGAEDLQLRDRLNTLIKEADLREHKKNEDERQKKKETERVLTAMQ